MNVSRETWIAEDGAELFHVKHWDSSDEQVVSRETIRNDKRESVSRGTFGKEMRDEDHNSQTA